LREEPRLRVLENRMLRRIFGPKRGEVTGEWRKLNNKELNDLYCSPNIIWVMNSRIMRWAGHVARMGERRCVCRLMVWKPEGKRPLGRYRRQWGIILKWVFIKWDANMDGIYAAQDRDRWRAFVDVLMNLRVL
jgi:hypothetical protein